MSESKKGHIVSKEVREKTAKRMKGNTYGKGYKCTEENKQKASERMKGNTYAKKS